MDPVTPVSTPAPAQPSTPAPAPAAPQTQTASQAAIASGSTGDYRAARRAERAGKPLEAVPVAAVTPSTPETLETPEVSAVAPAQPETPERQLSRRQQEINERSQRAVESATLTLREENARLREQLAARQGPTTPEPAPAPQTPEWKKYRDMPDAPKLADFDSVALNNSFEVVDWVMQEVTRSPRQQARHPLALQHRSAAGIREGLRAR
jgi:hypothetical protein